MQIETDRDRDCSFEPTARRGLLSHCVHGAAKYILLTK